MTTNVIPEFLNTLSKDFWLYFVIVSFIIFIYIIGIKNFLDKFKFQNNTSKPQEDQIKDQTKFTELFDIKLKVSEAKDLMDFMDKMLKIKFNYYFINEILPVYMANKQLDKPKIKELQESFYLDISALINKDFKMLFKKYYTKQGLEIYINEKFIYYLNKFDSLQNGEKINKLDAHKILS